MLNVFFDPCGVVHHEYAPQGQNINKEYYLEVLCRLCDAVRCKRPDLWAAGTWQLHHDTHQLIPRNWFKLSWPNTIFLWFSRLATLPTWWFLAVLPPENAAEMDSIWVMRRHYMGGSKIFRTGAVKIIKLTISPIGRRHPRSSSLPHVDTGPTVSFIFRTLSGSPFLSECEALSAFRPGCPQWYRTSVLSASISF